MVEVTQKYYGRWVVIKFIKEHNHVLEAPSIVSSTLRMQTEPVGYVPCGGTCPPGFKSST